MRIGDLSRLTGVPIPTIKYYQREGLLPYGERTGHNQSTYADEHVHRLRLARALVDIAHLPVATAREVLAATESPDLFAALGKVHYAVTAVPEEPTPPADAVDALLDRLNWTVKESNPSRRALSTLLDTLADLGHTGMLDRLDDYAALAARLAELDIDILGRHASKDEALETAVVVTLIGDTLISLLRRLAQEHHARKYR